jgi:hypothetical protein
VTSQIASIITQTIDPARPKGLFSPTSSRII